MGPRTIFRDRGHTLSLLYGLLIGLHGLLAVPSFAAELSADIGPRQPVKITATASGLMVVNRRSGTISLIPTGHVAVAEEVRVASQLTDAVYLPDCDVLIATDGKSNELIAVESPNSPMRSTYRQPVAAQPISVLTSSDGSSLTVASLWARQISRWDIDANGVDVRLIPLETLDLPFAPRLQFLCPDDENVIVADAFGPHLAVIQRRPLRLRAVYRIPGHNIGGLAISADGRELLVAHQMLNDFIPTTRDHVFWGNVVSNLLRSIPLAWLIQDRADSLRQPAKVHGSLLPLGQEGQAAGDPEQVTVTSQGAILVAFAGTGEIALRRKGERRFSRLSVGRRPTGISVAPDGKTAWVANRFDDSVAVVDLDRLQVIQTIQLSLPSQSTLADEGERLFYDATLSLHGWFSCHSCHTDGHTCGLLNDNFGDDALGAPKRIPSLLGVSETGPWAWNGQQNRLDNQVHKSMLLTMRGQEERLRDEAETAAIVRFLETLRPPPSVVAARSRLDTRAVAHGERLFAQLECAQCHEPPTYTTPVTYDVGLHDEHGASHFNPPSLRGLGQRTSFFHDNRARSLHDVLVVHPEPKGMALSDAQRDDLVAFLESL